jgi:hypothetical protein
MWFKPHLDWLLGALREKGGTGPEVVGAIIPKHEAHGIDIDGVPMGSAAFKAARHEETLEAAAAVIAGINKALISHGTGHIHRQAAFAMPRVCVYPRHLLRCACPSGRCPRIRQTPRRDAPELTREGSWDSGGGGASRTMEAQAP